LIPLGATAIGRGIYLLRKAVRGDLGVAPAVILTLLQLLKQ